MEEEDEEVGGSQGFSSPGRGASAGGSDRPGLSCRGRGGGGEPPGDRRLHPGGHPGRTGARRAEPPQTGRNY